jgi:endonuclease/exonuclease/phosphatase family metal-dependent hydrolase
VERDARESQLLHMSRSHELEEQGQLCVLAGDLNLRVGEEGICREKAGAMHGLRPPRVDDWTWCRGSSTARYDRVFLHDAGNGESAECAQIRRLTRVWPALSDHVALHVVVRRRSRGAPLPLKK